ncbi:GRIP1-associated protein 1 isoform X2 [Carettochelys insculpta]|uniref:GRIP1-associated protein 1 isoform X2 n=1 Tax=Carettochelys insculpta TaxID=44489 RepID=UPI003EC11CED
MAQALSAEEFQRLQAQLLELRTHNYQLSDELRKTGTELTSLRHRVTFLDKELAKAQKALSKSKKAQEVEALLSETEMLQSKLHSQEEDFRLQNSTLMQELSKLCSQIEQLETANKRMQEEGPAPDGALAPGPAPGELLRLQAENSALQKNVAALQERWQKETAQQAEGQGDAPRAPGPTGEAAMGQVPDASPCRSLSSALELKWETEQEEKRLLKDQLQNLEMAKQAEVSRLQAELSKLTDKLKKKQESFLRLQMEKEVLYTDSRAKLAELQQRRAEELQVLQIHNQELQQEVQAAAQSAAEVREQLQRREKEHADALLALQDQVASQSAESQEQVQAILSENDALRTSLAALEQIQTGRTQELNLLREQSTALGLELQRQQSEMEALASQRDDLSSQLQESLRANSRLLAQLQERGQERERLQLDLEEARKSAEKRKAMLDAMAVETQQQRGRHAEALAALRVQHEKEVLAVRARYEKELRELHEEKKRHEEELRTQLKEEKARSQELETSQQTVAELRLQIQSMGSAKGWFERRLKEAEELIEKHQRAHEEALQACEEQHAGELKLKGQEIEAAREELREAESSRDRHLETISQLRQEVKDTVDEQRILEKKGSTVLKDLKRQLQLERKRADKLQERLQDVLTNSKTRTGIEELGLAEISSPSRGQTGDSSSISSFSYREIMKEGSGPGSTKSNTGSPQSQRPAELSDEEVTELFQRLAETQQEKWLLEEKVKHLEVSSASMAEDLCRKSAIIETYVMDSRIDVSAAHGPLERSSLGSVLRDLVKPGDENVREMNKKLQNMLEEQLTKNMHLQKHLEVLSQEIVRLSKECTPLPLASPLEADPPH